MDELGHILRSERNILWKLTASLHLLNEVLHLLWGRLDLRKLAWLWLSDWLSEGIDWAKRLLRKLAWLWLSDWLSEGIDWAERLLRNLAWLTSLQLMDELGHILRSERNILWKLTASLHLLNEVLHLLWGRLDLRKLAWLWLSDWLSEGVDWAERLLRKLAWLWLSDWLSEGIDWAERLLRKLAWLWLSDWLSEGIDWAERLLRKLAWLWLSDWLSEGIDWAKRLLRKLAWLWLSDWLSEGIDWAERLLRNLAWLTSLQLMDELGHILRSERNILWKLTASLHLLNEVLHLLWGRLDLRKLAWLWLSDWLSEGIDWAERLLRKLAWLWLSDWLSEGIDWAERLLRNLAWLTSLQLMDELGHILRSERNILWKLTASLHLLNEVLHLLWGRLDLRKLAWLWLSDWLSEGVDWAERLLRKLAWLWLSDWLSEGIDWAERLLRKLAWLWLSDWLSEGIDWAERLLRKLAWLWLSDWLSEGIDWAERLLRKLAWLWLSDWLSEGVDWAERLLRNLAWLTSLQLMDELGHILRSERNILWKLTASLHLLNEVLHLLWGRLDLRKLAWLWLSDWLSEGVDWAERLLRNLA
jgi:transposase